MIRIFLAFLISITSLFALSEESIEYQMNIKLENIEHILQNSSLSKDDKRRELINILDEVFDFETMAKISLGRAYLTLTNEQQKEFIDSFVTRLKNSYLDKIDLYNGQKFKINGLKKPKQNRISLDTIIIGEKENYDIIYKFHTNDNNWLIYDVEIVGVSIVQTYRKQFSEFLATKDIKELLVSLK